MNKNLKIFWIKIKLKSTCKTYRENNNKRIQVLQENNFGVDGGEHSKPNTFEASLIQLGGLAEGGCKSPPPAGMLRGRAP